MKIGVISDSHIPTGAKALPETVLKTFKGVDHIIHAGDIMSIDVIRLEKLAPVTAVIGNIDLPELRKRFGDKKIVTLGNVNFGVFHGHGESSKTIERSIKCFQNDTVDCIIFGHSHIPYCQYHGDILLFNPGSPTDKRRNKHYSFGLIEIDRVISPHLIYFDAEGVIVEQKECGRILL